MMDRQDMAELTNACVAVGWDALVLPSGLLRLVTGRSRTESGWWNGVDEHPEFALAFLDAARKAYCALHVPGDRRLDEIALDLFEHYRVARRWLDSPIEEFSTEGAARALVALYRAGLLPEGRG